MGNSSNKSKTFNNNRPGLSEEGYALYRKYCALKAHFTGKYDYSKYGDATNVKRSSFIERRDAPMFTRVARGASKDLEGLLVSNFVHNPKFWIGDLESEEAYTIYNDWKRRTDQHEYYFKTDLESLDDRFTYVFRVGRGGDNPQVLEAAMAGEINFETFTILVHLLSLNRLWENKLADSYLAPKVIDRAIRYRPFVRYDKDHIIGHVKARWKQP